MMDISIDVIIQINHDILKKWLEENPSLYEGIAVNNDRLNEVIEIVKQQEELILKASYLMWVELHGLSLLQVEIKEQELFAQIHFCE